MKLEGTQRRLTVFIGESDHFGHTPLATEIVHRAQQAGMAGATVLRGARRIRFHPQTINEKRERSALLAAQNYCLRCDTVHTPVR